MQQWKFDWCHYSYFSAKLYFIELIFNIFLKSSLNFGSYCDEDLQASKNLSLMRKSMALEFNYFKKIEWYSYGSGTSHCGFSHLIGFFVVVAIDIQHVFPLMNVLNLVGSIVNWPRDLFFRTFITIFIFTSYLRSYKIRNYLTLVLKKKCQKWLSTNNKVKIEFIFRILNSN